MLEIPPARETPGKKGGRHEEGALFRRYAANPDPVTEPGFGAVDDGFALLGVLERLDECTRVMLRLRFEQDLTQSEIGEHVVADRQRRARRRYPNRTVHGRPRSPSRRLPVQRSRRGQTSVMADDQTTTQDPTTQHPGPEQPELQIDHPGHEAEMRPHADHGEESYRGSGRLQGRRALITGGDSGIGRAVALAFAREGADVAISHLPEEQEDADETLRLIEDAGRTGVSLPGDVTDEAYCRDIVERTVAELGGIDILVNNAAYQMAHEGLEDISSEELEHTIRTNIFALFHTCKAALAHMQAGSAIINTASEQAYDPSPSLMAYAATKAAIVNFTKNLSQQVLERGIRVNAVAPGPIWTPLIPATMPPDQVKSFGKQAPMGRAGQPVEVAPAFVYFASQESSYVSGEVIGVTGGTPLH